MGSGGSGPRACRRQIDWREGQGALLWPDTDALRQSAYRRPEPASGIAGCDQGSTGKGAVEAAVLEDTAIRNPMVGRPNPDVHHDHGASGQLPQALARHAISSRQLDRASLPDL